MAAPAVAVPAVAARAVTVTLTVRQARALDALATEGGVLMDLDPRYRAGNPLGQRRAGAQAIRLLRRSLSQSGAPDARA